LRTRFLSSKRGLPGMQVEFAVKTLQDVEKVLSVPYIPQNSIDPSGFIAKDEAMDDRGIVLADAGCTPISHIHELMGSELLAIWSIEERGTILQLIDVFLERLFDRLNAMIAAGVGPGFYTLGQEYAAPPLHSARDFREFCVEPDRRIMRKLREAGKILHCHCHGPLNAVLDDFPEMCDALHPIEAPPMGDVPLAEAKRRIGDRVCLEGNIQIGDVYAAPTEQLIDRVKQAIDDAAPGGGFILCPTASPHTEALTDVTVRNYVAMVETAAEYGR
jgi:uroporphyrinogen decarboxylase